MTQDMIQPTYEAEATVELSDQGISHPAIARGGVAMLEPADTEASTHVASREDHQSGRANIGPHAVLVGSSLLLPTAVLIGVLATFFARSGGPEAPSGGLTFLSGVPAGVVRPEPGEQHAYLALLLAPLLLSAGLFALHWAGRRFRISMTRGWLPLAASAGQALVLSLLLNSLGRQQSLYPYFHDWQLAVAAIAALVVAVAISVPGTPGVMRRLIGCRYWPASILRGRRRLLVRSLWFAVALLATIAFLSTTIYADGNIALSPEATRTHVPFTLEEFSAVLDGLTPLVNFTPQYTSLLPYLAAPVFALTGLTIGSFTTVMAVFSAIGLMSVFVALVRVTGRVAVASLLYMPFLAMTFYPGVRAGSQVHTVGSYYGVMPLRYAFPLLLTALVVAYALSAHRWRSSLFLGVVAGAGLVNNVEFGIAALGAVLVSVFVAEAARRAGAGRWRATALAELRVVSGMALAVAVFSLGTLARSGSLPDFRELVYFSQQFAKSGYYMLPMLGPIGLHLVIYLTFTLALVFALATAILGSADDRRRSRLALIAYSAVFGLGAGSYYVGRSHPLVLIALFSAWALCIVALVAEVGTRAREILAGPLFTRWLVAAPSACLAGLFVLCALAPSFDGFVFEQPHRLTSQTAPKIFAAVDMEQFVADCTRPGDSVMMIYPLGHRIAYDNGVYDSFPYNHPASVVTTRQVAALVHQLQANPVSAVFSEPLRPELVSALDGAGYLRVLERQPTIVAAKAAATGGTRLELWRPANAPLGCK